MKKERYENWVEMYIKAWNSNTPEDISAAFTEDGRYRTEPYAEAWQGHDEIIREWSDSKDEPGQTDFSYQVIAVEAIWESSKGKPRIETRRPNTAICGRLRSLPTDAAPISSSGG